MTGKELRATLCILMTSLLWGIAFTYQLVGMETMGPFTYNGVRFLVGALSLVPVILIFEKAPIDKAEAKLVLKYGILCGLVIFIGGNVQQIGMYFTHSAGKAGFFTSLYIIFVPLFGMFMGRKPGLATKIGVVFALVGVYLISVGDKFTGLEVGDILLLLCAVFFGLHIIIVDIAVTKIKSPVKLSLVQFVVCGILTLAVAIFTEDITLAGLRGGLFPLFFGGVMSVAVAYTLQIVGQKQVPPARAAVILSLESVFSVLAAALILGETMAPRAYIGCVFIFAGVLVSQLRPGKKTAPNSEKIEKNAK